MNKKNIFLIIILIILLFIVLDLNRPYIVGQVIQVDSTGNNGVIRILYSSNNSTGDYYIHSKNILHLNSMVKLKFKFSPFKDHVTKLSYPAQFSDEYDVEEIEF